MRELFRHIKLAVGAILVILFVSLSVLGGYRVYQDHFILDYDPHLTQKEYQNTVLDQNVNLVFYKKDCPYCQVGKSVVVAAANKGSYPTFYIDTQTEEGQKLVEKYQIEKAATIIKIRKGKIKKYLYASRDSEEKIVADEKAIQEAIND
ncbi:thioredoxin domain-containing protein [Streptococcus oralis]|uniref:thioredoxin domain-containing protein n=1 Tax=Streptococcus oralis TaxID=1303 RepID=UPI002284B922|nr:thioredoxin domain-containing protein [Streptococcus oralis]MCY7081091.1 thioredoxin domain-containing protein [Streptococcus oralis]